MPNRGFGSVFLYTGDNQGGAESGGVDGAGLACLCACHGIALSEALAGMTAWRGLYGSSGAVIGGKILPIWTNRKNISILIYKK
jgi:hypothetical protein